MFKHFRVPFLPAVICAVLVCFVPQAFATPQPPVSVLLQVNRIVGSPSGVPGHSGDGGPALNGFLSQPEGVSLDGAGNLYIADTGNDCIRRIDAATGVLTTVAGLPGQQGYGGDSGPATHALLNQPAGVLVDAHGNLYIADTGNQIVRFVQIDTGMITTVAGTPTVTPFDPANPGDGGPATGATLNTPTAVALDTAGNLYIADSGDNRIREVIQASQHIVTVAGNGAAAYAGDSGAATSASLNQPTGVGLDAAGNIYIADSANSLIRKVGAIAGTISTVAGVPGSAAFNNDGPATSTELDFPTGLAVDMAGQVTFSDRANSRLRKLTAQGTIVTLAGNGTAGLSGDGQLASGAEVSAPGGVALDPSGNIYLADSGNNQLRLISNGLGFPAAPVATTSPMLHTIFLGIHLATALTVPAIPAAENGLQEFSISAITGCSTDGVTSNAAGSVCAVPVGFTPAYPGQRTGTLEVTANSAPIPVSFGLYGIGLGPEAVVVPGIIQTVMNNQDKFNGIPLQTPGQAVTDAAGNLYVADAATNRVWRLDALTGSPSIVAGGGSLAPALADGGLAVNAALNTPSAVALDAASNLYIAETGANRVRQVNLPSGIITTVAGTGTPGVSGDNGPADSAEVDAPAGIAATAAGDLFIADTGSNRIRSINASSGIITTIAGTGTPGYSGDGLFAALATFRAPQSIAVDPVGRLYIADTGNHAIRSIDPVTGIITTVAGNGSAGFSGDLAAATAATLNTPSAVAVDPAGNLYIADTGNARVRKVYAQTGTIVTLAGTGQLGDQGDNGPSTQATLYQPSGVTLDAFGQLLIADRGNDTVRIVSTDTPGLNFGTAPIGSTTAAQTDFLSNIGNQPLAITRFDAPTDFPFAQDPSLCSVGSLAPGGWCDLGYVFHPTASGPIVEDGLITDNALNAPGSQQDVELSGNGIIVPTIATATTVAVNPAAAIYGTPVTLTATVSAGNVPVTGSVVFSINGIEQAAAQLTGGGTATVTLRAAPTRSDVVTASFAAQGNDQASTSPAVALVVTPAGSQTTLTASTQQMRLGQNIILTANVASSTTGIPTGTVEFLNGSAEIGQAVLDPTGQAIFNTPSLPAGNGAITAHYLGDGNFQQSTSSSISVIVANDTLTMTASTTLLTIAAGKTGQTVLTLTPKNGFAGNVSLSCAGLIQGATCQFSTPSLSFTAQAQTAQTVTLVINPNTVAAAGFGLFPTGSGPLPRLLLLLLGLGAALLLFRARRQSVWMGLGRALLVLCCLGGCLLTGCANLVPQQPVQAAVTVQASTPATGIITTTQLQVYMAQ